MTKRVKILIAVACSIAIVALAGWPIASAWEARKVHLTNVELWRCASPSSIADTRKQLALVGDGLNSQDALTGPSTFIYNDKKLDCTARTILENSSGHAITPVRLTWRFYGPTSGMGLRGSRGDDAAYLWTTQGRANDGLDAVFSGWSGGSVGGGDSIGLTARLTHGKGCSSAGAFTTIGDSPTLRFRVLGIEHTVAASGPGLGYVGTKDSSCDK